MGKKVSQSTSVKTSKNNEKKDFNSWIKVLKPKVYITDSSSFKQLVQELTGNGNGTTSSSHTLTKPQEIKKVPVIEIDEDDEPESSAEAASFSFDATTDSSEFCNQVFLDQDFTQVYNEVFLEDINLENSVANQQVDLLAYWDIEKLLLDYDSRGSLCNGYGPIEQDVSIYDYELSGVI